ncbi:MAG: hypothetical protein ACI8TL_001845 [Natronomonas sp.]
MSRFYAGDCHACVIRSAELTRGTEKLTVCYLAGAVVGAGAVLGTVVASPDRYGTIPGGVIAAALGMAAADVELRLTGERAPDWSDTD